MGNQDVIDSMLADMRNHVSSLHNKLSVADAAVNRCQTVNDKIVIMKEYEDRVSTINSCWRSKNRKGLVANLQHENRQMQALEEENRRLRFALKEMEDGVHLIMSDYRRVIAGFTRSDTLLEFARQHMDKTPERCIDHEKFMVLSAIVDRCVSIADERIIEQAGIIAELRTENATLRELAYFKPMFRSNGAVAAGANAAGGMTQPKADETAGDGPTSDSAATTPVKTPQTKAAGKKPSSSRGSQIPVNGGKSQPAVKKESAIEEAATTGTPQYSWPVHVNREPLKTSKNVGAGRGNGNSSADENNGGGRTSLAAAVTKASLPRENPARRGSATSPKTRAVGLAEKSAPAVESADDAESSTPPISIADGEDVPNVEWTTVPSTNGNDEEVNDHPMADNGTDDDDADDKSSPTSVKDKPSDTVDQPPDALPEH